MAAYRLKQQDTELADLLSRAEAGEEIDLERNGTIVAKIIPFREPEASVALEDRPIRRQGGQNVSGLAGIDLSVLDEPWTEDIQRAFGMLD